MLKPSSPGQHQIEDDEVRAFAGQNLIERLRGVGHLDGEAFSHEQVAHQAPNVLVILDDDDERVGDSASWTAR